MGKAARTFLDFVMLFLLSVGTPLVSAPSIVHIGNSVEPKDLDPHRVMGLPEMDIVINLFEGLVAYDSKTNKAVPGVAYRWSTSKDNLTWTFNLRKNARWSNGDPVTAQDFVYSWRRLLSPDLASEYAFYGFFIKNGALFNKGELKDPSQLGLKAVDSHTFQVILEKPTPYLVKLCYYGALYPVHAPSVEKYGGNWSRPGNLVSNGAYILTKWEVNKVIVIKKNPTYWDEAQVKIPEARFYPTENQYTEEKMFRTGQLDVTYTVPQEKVAYWRKDKGGIFQSDPMLSIFHLKLNVKKPPFDDKRVRWALALAIDRNSLVQHVTQGNEQPAAAFTVPGTGGYYPKKYFPTDLRRVGEAKRLLAEAGFGPGKPFPKVDLIYNTSEANKKVAEAIQQMWKKHLGIEVGILNQEWKVYINTLTRSDFHIIRARWGADYDDPNTFLDLHVTDGGMNNSRFSNKKYDQLIHRASSLPEGPKRMKLFSQAEDILMAEMPVIPLFIERSNYLKAKNVEGWHPNPMHFYPLKYVRFSESARRTDEAE